MLAAAVQDLSLDFDYAPLEIVDPQIARGVHVGDVGRHLAHAYIRVLLVLIESLEQPGLRVVEAFRELIFRLANPRIDDLADFFDESPLNSTRSARVTGAFPLPSMLCPFFRVWSSMSISLKVVGRCALSSFLCVYLQLSAQAASFEPDQRQVHRSVEFLARSGGGYVYFGNAVFAGDCRELAHTALLLRQNGPLEPADRLPAKPPHNRRWLLSCLRGLLPYRRSAPALCEMQPGRLGHSTTQRPSSPG